jgi:hypothetical protein
MTLRDYCICILSTMILAGCATGGASLLNEVKLGMSEAEVIEAIGAPSTTSASGDTAYLHYNLYSGGIFPDAYFVRLTEGRVDAFGRKGDFNLGY